MTHLIKTTDSPSTDRPAREAPTVAAVFRSTAWAGYMACIWVLAFAAISFNWAAGRTRGSDTIGPAITGMAHDPMFVAVLLVTGAVKVMGGLLDLALVRS